MVLDRRGFIKFIAGASAGIMATPLPWKLLDDISIWSQNWSWIPSLMKGGNSFSPVVSKTCPSSAAFTVRLVDGRPVRALPVEDHPLGGGLTPVTAAEVQLLHSPARVSRPLLRGPDGAFMELPWSRAAEMLADKLKEAGGNSAFISGDETGSTNEVLSALAKALGSDQVYLMPSEWRCATKAVRLMGIRAQIGYDLEHSDYVFAIGANMLESWGTVARNRRAFRAANPHPEAGVKAATTFAYAGPVQNNSAAVAKPWLPIYPGTEAILAMGIANMLVARGCAANASDFGAFKDLAARYTLADVVKITGVEPKKLEAVVNSLLAAKAPLVVVGSEFNQGAGAAPVLAGFAVNALLGNINKPGGISLLPEPAVVLEKASSRSQLHARDLVARLGGWAAGKDKPALLVMHEANPLYALPDRALVKRTLKDIPFKVSFSTFLDETAEDCNLVLPIPMGLERIDDVDTPYGSGQSIYCVTRPASPPMEDTRSTANACLFLAKKLGFDLGVPMYEDLLKARAGLMKKDFTVLAGGTPAVSDEKVTPDDYALRADVLEKALARKPMENKLRLAPYARLSMGTAKTGIPPFNTKTLRASELDGKTMSVMMNAATAAKAGLAEGDSVVLDSGKQKIQARLHLFEGVMSDTVAAPLGYGHSALDEFSRNKGANAMDLLSASPEPGTGLAVWSQAGVIVTKA